MFFLFFPLAFALSWGFYAIPGLYGLLSRFLKSAYHRFALFLKRTAGDRSDFLTPSMTLLLTAGLFCLLEALLTTVHPLLSAVLFAPLLPLPALLRDALDVRAALEEGECRTDEDRARYEERVISAIGSLADGCARLFPLLFFAALLTPLRLGAAAGWTIFALHGIARAGCAGAARWDAKLERIGERLLILCVLPTAALCGTEMGMAVRARRQGIQNVLLSAVGVDPSLQRGHRPVTGDISQACLCVCVASGVLLAAVLVPLFLLFASLGIAL
jgi:hypothetical protein